MARKFYPPRVFQRSSNPRPMLDRNFRELEAYINDVFSAHTEAYKVFAIPVRARGTLPLDIVLTRAFRYIETYLRGFASRSTALSGGWDSMIWDRDMWDGGPIPQFATYPRFNLGADLSSAITRNWTKLVTYLNTIADRL